MPASRMIKRVFTVAIVSLLIFILGGSGISYAVEVSRAQVSSHATPLSAQPPDLVVEAIAWSPENPSIGDMVTFTVTVKNQGGGSAASSRVAYYLDDVYQTSDEVNPLDAGATASETFTWTARAGTYTIRAVADASNKVAESDETNNVKMSVFSTLAPDLIIEAITWSPEEPSEGDMITFSVTIKNQGSKNAVSSHVHFYIDGFSRGYQEVPRLDVNAAVTRTFTWTARAGVHTIRAVADSSQKVTESDETNNEKTVNFQTLAPDLIVGAITWSPENPSKGDNVTFTVTIKNQGNGRAGYSRVAYYIDDAYLTLDTVNPVEPGATENKTFSWFARAGTHAIKAVADANNQVAENDETNNEKAVNFQTIAPDLIIEAITWLPSGPSVGGTVTFTVKVKNQGAGKSGSFQVNFYVDSSSLGSQDVPEMDAGATVTRTFTWTAQAGAHTIKAVADPGNQVVENDETNNEKIVAFSTLAPDLIIEKITGSPSGPSVGDTVTFTVTIKNKGAGKSDFFHVTFSVGGNYLTSSYVSPIESGATDNQTFSWTARAGAHTIKAIADANNQVTESDETNNEKAITFQTIAPDLIIEAITGSPSGPSVGDTVIFTVTIKNQGSGKAGSFHVHFYIDGSSLGYQDVPEIGAGAKVTRTFTWIAQAGLYAIKAAADFSNQVIESDESNNDKLIIFPVPDLIIEAITGSPSGPSVGDTVTFTVTVKNQGSGRVGSSHVHFYIDGSSLGYQDVPEMDAGAAVTRTFTWTAQAGSHAIKAVADSSNQATESDETNNEGTVTFATLAPDLIIEAIKWSPAKPAQSDNVTFTVTIKNKGAGKSVLSQVVFSIGDAYQTSGTVNPIDIGATANKTFIWPAQEGLYTIKAVADPGNQVMESNETNNEKTVNFSVFLPSASAPAPAPAPKPQGTPAAKPAPAPPPQKGIWLGWWVIAALVILGGILALVKMRS